MPGRIPDPRIKDAAMFEALGADRVRLADATHPADAMDSEVVAESGRSGDYANWSVEDLRHRAAELEIAGRSTMHKDELIAALRHR